jgi:hypothetical protein
MRGMDVTEKGEASSRTRLAGRGHRLIVPSKYQMELKPGPDFPLGPGRAETRELQRTTGRHGVAGGWLLRTAQARA